MSSMAMIGDGVELTVTDSDEFLRNGTTKLEILRLPLDAILLQDEQREEALLPDYSLELGVTSLDGFDMNSGEVCRLVWMTERCRGRLREIKRAVEN
jgi:hypothetical protein